MAINTLNKLFSHLLIVPLVPTPLSSIYTFLPRSLRNDSSDRHRAHGSLPVVICSWVLSGTIRRLKKVLHILYIHRHRSTDWYPFVHRRRKQLLQITLPPGAEVWTPGFCWQLGTRRSRTRLLGPSLSSRWTDRLLGMPSR